MSAADPLQVQVIRHGQTYLQAGIQLRRRGLGRSAPNPVGAMRPHTRSRPSSATCCSLLLLHQPALRSCQLRASTCH